MHYTDSLTYLQDSVLYKTNSLQRVYRHIFVLELYIEIKGIGPNIHSKSNENWD